MVDNTACKVIMGWSADSRHSLGIGVHMGVRDEAERQTAWEAIHAGVPSAFVLIHLSLLPVFEGHPFSPKSFTHD